MPLFCFVLFFSLKDLGFPSETAVQRQVYRLSSLRGLAPMYYKLHKNTFAPHPPFGCLAPSVTSKALAFPGGKVEQGRV